MTRVEVEICNRLGLHARAAACFVQTANEFESRIEVHSQDHRVNGKSILGLLTLAASRGSRLWLVADGADEAPALARLEALIRDRFGESE